MGEIEISEWGGELKNNSIYSRLTTSSTPQVPCPEHWLGQAALENPMSNASVPIRIFMTTNEWFDSDEMKGVWNRKWTQKEKNAWIWILRDMNML